MAPKVIGILEGHPVSKMTFEGVRLSVWQHCPTCGHYVRLMWGSHCPCGHDGWSLCGCKAQIFEPIPIVIDSADEPEHMWRLAHAS